MNLSTTFLLDLMLRHASAGKYARASPSGNGRQKNGAKPFVRHAGLNGKEPKQASWKNGNFVKPATTTSMNRACSGASGASSRCASTKVEAVRRRVYVQKASDTRA